MWLTEDEKRAQELTYRLGLWSVLLSEGGSKGVAAARVNALRLFYGGRGIWFDGARTRSLTPDGVTVGVLHTGRSYADDLYDGGILYHYPTTKQPGRDGAEVAATKAARELALPIFVVSQPSHSRLRNVDLGWIEAWDDKERLFLITFADEQPADLPAPEDEDDAPFQQVETVLKKQKTTTDSRSGQHRFKFRVFRRCGAACAVCGLGVIDLLDAAHIRPRREDGTNDPRNGLVLCATHHRAYDAGLFAIDPHTLELVFPEVGPNAYELRITAMSLAHLPRRPHVDVLAWRWHAWVKNAAPALT